MSRKSRRGQAKISGIFIVDKPAGVTSHDVVQAVRRASGERRVGHAGTLDPMATGVLLICMGKATRLSEYLMEGRKRYRATIHLGVTTDTYDAQGQVTSQADALAVTRSQVEAAAARFVGVMEQRPPMYSAIKRQGQPLYKLARQGIQVEREPRPVHIHDIRFLAWAPPLFTLEITCSKGTYIRSLAHDLGQALGCGAHLAALTRTASGSFDLEQAITLPALLDALGNGTWAQHLRPMGEALGGRPAWTVDADTARRIQQGQQVEGLLPSSLDRDVAEGDGPDNLLCRAYNHAGDLIGVLRFLPETGKWQPDKVFVD